MQELNVWLSTSISDLDLTFSKRMVMTIMHEEQSALILLKKGGKPKGEEDYEEMEPYERNAVEAFEKFCAAMRFKQNRLLVFYADPHLD